MLALAVVGGFIGHGVGMAYVQHRGGSDDNVNSIVKTSVNVCGGVKSTVEPCIKWITGGR